MFTNKPTDGVKSRYSRVECVRDKTLIMFWCLIVFSACCRGIACSDHMYCEPAEEGQSFDVKFKAQFSNITSELVWRITTDTEKRHEEVSFCRHNSPNCFDLWDDYTGHWRADGNDVTYGLHISKVNCTHRGMVLELGTMDRSKNFTQLFSCTMDVYSQPQQPECHATRVAPGKLNVTYTAVGVFPQVKCLMNQYEILTETLTDISSSDIEVSHEQESPDAAYSKTTCRATVEVGQAGTYVYTTLIKPQFSGKHNHHFELIRPVNTYRINITENGRCLHPSSMAGSSLTPASPPATACPILLI